MNRVVQGKSFGPPFLSYPRFFFFLLFLSLSAKLIQANFKCKSSEEMISGMSQVRKVRKNSVKKMVDRESQEKSGKRLQSQ